MKSLSGSNISHVRRSEGQQEDSTTFLYLGFISGILMMLKVKHICSMVAIIIAMLIWIR